MSNMLAVGATIAGAVALSAITAAGIYWMKEKWALQQDMKRRAWVPPGTQEFPRCTFSGAMPLQKISCAPAAAQLC